jgi:predicted transcriptional regulator
MVESKVCSKCKIDKPLGEYHKDRKGRLGCAAACKVCESKRKKRSYGPTSDLKMKGVRLNTDTHKWCPSCSSLLERAEFYNNRAAKDGLKSECKSCHNEREKAKRRKEPAYKIRTNVSRSIRGMLNGKQKTSSCLNYLPYTMKELKEHLEDQFDDRMTWDNYGSYWDIDHLYPHSLLPYDTMEHPNFTKCWSLDNLRPLEKIENIKKSNKVLQKA